MSNKDKTKQAESEWKQAINWFYSNEDIKMKETSKLNKLWKNAQPMTENELYLVRQISGLSRCNWNLEESIKSIIEAIGKEERATIRIGHNHSITNNRWKKAWAYYLSLKNWLPTISRYTGFPVLLEFCDPDNVNQKHVENLLGKQTELKILYVELFAIFLEANLMGRYSEESAKMIATKTTVESLIHEVKKHGYDEMILAAVQTNPETHSEGKLSWYEVCHHKFFRRCDLTISSIGENKWRGTFKERSSEGKEIQELLLRYSSAMEAWISNKDVIDEFIISNIELLGKKSPKKIFQVNLLNAFLKGQYNNNLE
ncbi:MAG: hypothetical protein FK733_19610 [Asgard group archaeon]|nr:hypothetical protein [Asgard group archaeon]